MVKTVASTLPKVMVTAGPEAPLDGSVAETSSGKKDLEVVVIPMWRQALIRALRTYIDAFLTFFIAGTGMVVASDGTVDVMGAQITLPSFWVSTVSAAGGAALVTGVSFLKNISELLYSLLDPRFAGPKYRA